MSVLLATTSRPFIASLWRGGRAARLGILIYHRVLAEKDPLQADIPDRREFDWQMGLLRSYLNPLPLAEAVRRLGEGSLPPRSVCVTFDDGYADNYEVALPILQRHAIPATFFIATGFLDGGRMWNDSLIELVRRWPEGEQDLERFGLGRHAVDSVPSRRTAIKRLITAIKHLPYAERARRVEALQQAFGYRLPEDLMLRRDQLLGLASAGMEIGAHTVSHPILTRLDPAEAERELAEGRARLQELTGQPVGSFAYPNGVPGQDYAAEHVDMVRQLGFERAVSTAWGVCTARRDRFQLPRFTPWDRTPLRFLGRLLQNCLRTTAAAV